MIISVVYRFVRCLLGCLMMLARHRVSKDAELLVLRHENAVLRRPVGRVRYEPSDRLWLAGVPALQPHLVHAAVAERPALCFCRPVQPHTSTFRSPDQPAQGRTPGASWPLPESA